MGVLGDRRLVGPRKESDLTSRPRSLTACRTPTGRHSRTSRRIRGRRCSRCSGRH